MDPVAPLPLSPTPPSRVPLRSGGREDSPGAFWSRPEPSAQDLSFKDLLAVINPLQHLPVVGTLYRELTGDTLHPAARVLGGALFGGPFGMFSAALNAMVEQETGKDLAQTAVALVLNGGVAEPAANLAEAPAPSNVTAPATTPIDDSGDVAGPVAAPAATAEIEPQAAPAPPPYSARRAAPAGARDLGYYQAMAGARLPPAGATTAPQNAGGHAPLLRPPLVIAAAPAPDAVAASAQAADHPFTESVRRGLNLYQQMKRQEAPGRSVDRVE